ncbi:MAG: adenylyltransferase/cytidyltransferase family protein [Clostridiales bacterium]|nr:adenylyltransferase/cytidyltransferase family protein [Clostridiales bacterium]MDD7334439.1 adenylyltransferase/cytidyltransferase family protein [Lachnospiraceae bacterium]MDY5514075.1 adenylyltransferase/cytidyltransferase family protein [Candidatus Ventricola sp.]
MAKEYRIGYTQGVFDMFHIGHLNLINHAKEYCDCLIVGVNSDELVQTYKHKKTVINEMERQLIVSNLKAVDQCFIVSTLDKVELWKSIHFDAVFIGDDWKGNARWAQTEKELEPYHAKVVYLPHTRGISSTILRQRCDHKIDG